MIASYSPNKGIQETLEALLALGCPPLPVAPKQDARKSWVQWNGRTIYAHHVHRVREWHHPNQPKTVIVDGERVQASGEFCRISYTKIQGVDASVRGDYVRLDEHLQPIPRFTGKNPSYLDKNGIPRILHHGEYQNRLPSPQELKKWFAHPNNGIGTLGGHGGVVWIDFDAKNYPTQEDCDRAVEQIREQLPGPTWVERTGSGGYRIAVEPQQTPTFTNFATTPGGDHVGEALFEGRFTVLAPSIHPNGNAYKRLEFSQPIEVESLEAIGIYPAKDEVETLERKLAREAQVEAQVLALREDNPHICEAHARKQVEREINTPTNPQDNPWDIRNFATYFEGYTEKGEWAYAKCPHHNGTSLTSLRVNLHTGAIKAWCGCDVKDVYKSGLKLASDLGFKVSAYWNDDSRKSKEISKSQWWERYGLPNQFKKFTDFVAKSVYRVQAKGFKKSTVPRISNPRLAVDRVLRSEPIEVKPPGSRDVTSRACLSQPSAPLRSQSESFLEIDYKPGELIDPIEWERVGCPPIRVADEFDEDFSPEAIALGYKHILNGKPAGTGKSHKAGLFSIESLGLEIPTDHEGREIAELKPRIFYHAGDSLNPTTATVEENFVHLPARSAGYVKDSTRQTALGNDFWVHVKPGERPDIQGNCRDAESFFYSYKQGRAIHGGKGSELCESCPEYMQEDRVVCPLLLSKRDVLKNSDRIRANLNAMPKPRSNYVGVLDEATAILEATKDQEISSTQLQATIGKLATREENNKFFLLLKSLFVNVAKQIEEFDPQNKLYGSSHIETVEALLLKRVEIEAIPPASDEWKSTPRYDLPCLPPGRSEAQEKEKQSVIPSEDSIKFNLLKLKLTRAKVRFEDYIWKIYGDDFLNNNSWGIPCWNVEFVDGEEINTFVGWKWSAPSVEEVIAESDRLISSFKIPSLATPKERLKALKEELLPNWVPGLLKILSGDKNHSLRVNWDALSITKPHRRAEMIVKAYGTTFYLDATAIPEDLETMLRLTKRSQAVKIESLEAEKKAQVGIKEFGEKYDSKLFKEASDRIEEIDSEIHRLKLDSANRNILHVVGEEIDYGHLDIKFVRGLGKLGKQRYSKKNGSNELNFDSLYAVGSRAGILAKAICESDPTRFNRDRTSRFAQPSAFRAKKTGLIDHACFVDADSDLVNSTYLELKETGQIEVLGAHFREGRGSNLFLECVRLIVFGKAIKNLGSLAAQWHAMTGEIVEPTNLAGRYGKWVARQVVAEAVQEIARTRANRRQTERLEVYMVGEYSDDEISAIANHYPGANIDILEASDICIEAASKGTQTAHYLTTAIRTLLEDSQLTATKVGEMIGVSRSRVSQLCKELYGNTFRGLKKTLETLLELLNSKTNVSRSPDVPSGCGRQSPTQSAGIQSQHGGDACGESSPLGGFPRGCGRNLRPPFISPADLKELANPKGKLYSRVSDLIELTDEEFNIASEFFPNLVEDWQKGDLTAAQVVEDVICVAQAFGDSAFRRIVGGTPPPIIAQLVLAILLLLPHAHLKNHPELIAILE